MTGPFTAALAAEAVVVVAIFLIAAVLTNAGALTADIERMGWM